MMEYFIKIKTQNVVKNPYGDLIMEPMSYSGPDHTG